MPARTIAVMSPKGGVGKTAVSVNLAAALSAIRKKVLLVDANIDTPHVAIYYGFVGYKYSLEDVLNGKVNVTDAIYKTDEPNLHILPSRVFKDRGDNNAKYRLINLFHQLNKVADAYDFIIIDSKPSAGLDFIRMIKNLSTVIVSTPEITSIIEAKKLEQESKAAGVHVLGMALNRINRKQSGSMSEEEVRKIVELKRIWMVPEEPKMLDALKSGMPIVFANRKSRATRAFLEIARDLTLL